MNILIISPFLPYPLDQGGKIRVFNIIKHLARNHRLTLACLSPTDAVDYGPLRDYCAEIVVVAKPPRPVLDLARFLLGGEPFNCLRFASPPFAAELRELQARKTFDLVQVEFSLLWRYATLFPGTPVVLDAHNIEYRNIRQIGGASGNPLRSALYRLEERRLKAVEERAWRECALCCAVSDQERDEIAAGRGEPARVITTPNGVDPERFTFRPKQPAGKKILFLGGMDYFPNLDAARWFLDEIFPLIRREEPGARLLVVGRELGRLKGRDPGSGIRDQAQRDFSDPEFRVPCPEEVPDPGSIEFHENVPDVLPWFYEADLLVVPLRQGAGTRIKVLEAFAAGLPVVSTAKGCEGIAARDGEHLLIADAPVDFAAAVVKLVRDAELGGRLAAAARQLAAERYTWAKTVAVMEEGYRAIAGTREPVIGNR